MRSRSRFILLYSPIYSAWPSWSTSSFLHIYSAYFSFTLPILLSRWDPSRHVGRCQPELQPLLQPRLSLPPPPPVSQNRGFAKIEIDKEMGNARAQRKKEERAKQRTEVVKLEQQRLRPRFLHAKLSLFVVFSCRKPPTEGSSAKRFYLKQITMKAGSMGGRWRTNCICTRAQQMDKSVNGLKVHLFLGKSHLLEGVEQSTTKTRCHGARPNYTQLFTRKRNFFLHSMTEITPDLDCYSENANTEIPAWK